MARTAQPDIWLASAASLAKRAAPVPLFVAAYRRQLTLLAASAMLRLRPAPRVTTACAIQRRVRSPRTLTAAVTRMRPYDLYGYHLRSEDEDRAAMAEIEARLVN